jgi:hypothetical protein
VRLFLLFICIFVCNKITETLRSKKYGVYRMVTLERKRYDLENMEKEILRLVVE